MGLDKDSEIREQSRHLCVGIVFGFPCGFTDFFVVKNYKINCFYYHIRYDYGKSIQKYIEKRMHI